MIFGRPFSLVCTCVDCALVVCTHSHTKSLGGYQLGRVVWVLPCAIERVGVVDLAKRFVVSVVTCHPAPEGYVSSGGPDLGVNSRSWAGCG